MGTGKFLILAGIILIIIGGMVILLEKAGIKPGQLPGDIIVKGENSTLYFPVTTCIILSIIFSLLGMLFKGGK